MNAILDSVRVLEIGESIAAQYLGQLLGDQGADVLKLEPPGGGEYRGCPQFHAWNRNKRSAVADLDSDDGRAFARELTLRADVLISDHLPGLETRGLHYASLAADNPRLVHAWLPPYGPGGPFAEMLPDDAVAAALAGNFSIQASNSGDPVFVVVPIASYTCALLAASAVCSALYERERSGMGQQVTVSWLAGALAHHSAVFVAAPDNPDVIPPAARVRLPQGANGAYKLYRASDDWLFIACGNNQFFNKLCIALGRPELAADERFSPAPWGITDAEHQRDLRETIAPIIAGKPRAYWLEHLGAADVPCAPVLSRREYLDHPQFVHNGLRLEMDDPQFGPVVMADTALSFSKSAPVNHRPAPVLGAHSKGALEAWPLPGRTPFAPTLEAPLSGVRVLDLSSYIAGAYAPCVLAEYGADVIKVESLEGDAFRAFGLGFLGWNRGKRGVALDLRSDEGREIVYELARRADVVVENFRAGIAKRLKVDYETLSALNPSLVYCAVAGWGESGPYAGQPAFDPVFQASSGVMRAQGGDGDPVFLACAITDYGAAHLAAYGVTTALYRRALTGEGRRVLVTLTGAVTAMQSGEFIFRAGGGDFGHATVGSEDFLGPSPAHRLYRASDGWLVIACRSEREWQALAKAIGRPELAYAGSWPAAARTDPKGGLAGVVAEMISEDTVGSWVRRFAAHGIAAGPVIPLGGVLTNEQVAANGYVVEHEHPTWGRTRQAGTLARFSRTPSVSQRAAPLLGQQTGDVLRELGYDLDTISSFRIRRTVA